MYEPPLAYQMYSSTPGLFGGPSGTGIQPNGGVNRNVQYLTAGLGGLGGMANGGGLGGAIGGMGGGSVAGTNSLMSLLSGLFSQGGGGFMQTGNTTGIGGMSSIGNTSGVGGF